MPYTLELAGIIEKVNNDLICYDTTFKTYAEAIVPTSLSLHLICVFELQVESSYYYVDMNKLLSKYLVSSEYLNYTVNNWDDLTNFINNLFLIAIEKDDFSIFSKYLTRTAIPDKQYYKTINTSPYEDPTEIIMTRVTPFADNYKNKLYISSVAYDDHVQVSYTNIDTPYKRNMPAEIEYLHDLVFTKQVNSQLKFENTLPSVDGIICYPVYNSTTDELFATNGASMLNTHTTSNSFNTLLIDFSNLGTLTTYKLSDCKQDIIFKNNYEYFTYTSDYPLSGQIHHLERLAKSTEFLLRIKLPIGCENGIPLIVLGGRLFIPGLDNIISYMEGGYICVELRSSIALLENIVASNLQHQNLFFKNTDIFRITLRYLLFNVFGSQGYSYQALTDEWKAVETLKDRIIPFICLLKTDKTCAIAKTNSIMAAAQNRLLFPAHKGGLLVNMLTREFIDYTKINYLDQTFVSFTPQESLFIQKREGSNTDYKTSSAIYDRHAWADGIGLFINHYNQFNSGEYLKDFRNYCLLNLYTYRIGEVESKTVQGEEVPEYIYPVYTNTFEPVQHPQTIKFGIPEPITQLKVYPKIDGETVTTSTLIVANGDTANGEYNLIQPELVGIDRVWKHKNNYNLLICYDNQSDEYPCWVIKQDNTILYHTDRLTETLSPYSSVVIWRKAN